MKSLGPKDKKLLMLGKNELSRMELECRESGKRDPKVEKGTGRSPGGQRDSLGT